MLAVVSTPRSGSTFLCSSLNRSGVGDIREYLNFDLRDQASQIKESGSERWLRYIRSRGGLKIFRETTALIEIELQINWLAFFHDHLDAIIYLKREDTIEQAISHYIALHTQIWQVYNHKQARQQAILSKHCPYDFNRIYRSWVRFYAEKEFWEQSLKKIRTPILHVNFERMVQQPVTVLGDCLQFLGHNPAQLRLPERLKPSSPKPERLRMLFLQDMERRFGEDALCSPLSHLSLPTNPNQ